MSSTVPDATIRRSFKINGRFLAQPISGVQRVARELTKAIDRLLGERDYAADFSLICEEHADLSAFQLTNIPIRRLAGSRGYLWEQFSLPRAIGDSELICLGNTAPLRSLFSKHCVTVMIHDLSYRIYPFAYSRAYRYAHAAMLPAILSRSHRIVTVSETEKALLIARDPRIAPRVFVAQNGGWSDGITVKKSDNKSPVFGKDYLLYVGSMSQRKNLSGLVEVAIRLARERGIPFLFVGGRSRALADAGVTLPQDVIPLIHFAGQVEDLNVLAEIYRNARCLVFPSFYEASPLPPLEAMQFGCPVVGSNLDSMFERCGDAIEYCDPSSIDGICSAVLRIIDDPDHAAALVKKGFARAGRYSWSAQAELILSHLVG